MRPTSQGAKRSEWINSCSCHSRTTDVPGGDYVTADAHPQYRACYKCNVGAGKAGELSMLEMKAYVSVQRFKIGNIGKGTEVEHDCLIVALGLIGESGPYRPVRADEGDCPGELQEMRRALARVEAVPM